MLSKEDFYNAIPKKDYISLQQLARRFEVSPGAISAHALELIQEGRIVKERSLEGVLYRRVKP